MGKVIAIDGPSGSGKSTVAKLLSELLGFKYLDTGALYRAVALGLIKHGIRPEDSDKGLNEASLNEALKKIQVSFSNGKVFLDGVDVSMEIRTTEAGHYSSVFSAREPVRDFLLPVQREAALNHDLVAEGRDMTTVIFPDAWKKFYIDADVQTRAKRRHLQLVGCGIPITMEDALKDVVERDKRDSTRAVAPLRKAEGAVFMDSSNLTVEEVVKRALEVVKNSE